MPFEDVLKVQIAEELLLHQGSIELTLSGNCMWPTVRHGDVVLIQKPSYQSLKHGDVVIYKISDGRFHANTIFSNSMLEREDKKAQYIGKIMKINRAGKNLDLDGRSFLRRRIDMISSPANPFLLGFPNLLWRKCCQLFNR